MDSLRTFYENEKQRESVKVFMIECLGQLAIKKSFAGEPTGGIKEANETITFMFDKLDEIYGKIPVIKNQNSR